ncbi:chemotaxis protein CheB [Methylobacter sp. YRD-M1]|uniref:chemotaxis protein CheB n=1 Tax=Methylobacter sp. YRD-M1 TaxID=2911520 RepID=UPI00227D09B0|nr:chemotaxis protein CheB [Methylobacter sp. YRD-M1]WAK01540.1 PAS domain-containing protein [Methylobacter sp. YRD-M1]
MEKNSSVDQSFPIVGIGASAGGMEALQEFFKTMPADRELAFVVVVHLDPNHVSLLPDLLQKHTTIRVTQITDGLRVEPNNIYIIPPNKTLSIHNKRLHLTELETPRFSHLPIDTFFRSLAQDQGDKAIGIVLSGTGSDGSLGLMEIKAASGLVIVQNEASAQYTGMPKNAINTGVVDYILSPDKMPTQLIQYAQYREDTNDRHIVHLQNIDVFLQKIFFLIHNQTGHDFSMYKKNTICRRIERRMQLRQITRIADYVAFLQKNEQEIGILANELFIGVTSFFRDAEAYSVLKNKILPAFLSQKPQNYILRVWVPGCSTGEEAYSIAIVIQECLDTIKHHIDVQIFGTDINENAIEKARRGLYLSGIENVDVSPERLKRFFIREDNNYRIKKSIREMVVFAPQNIISDPPFTKLDIISCRNLLIYFRSELQRKVLQTFHYSLKEDGIMFLGPSETTGQSDRFFSVLDKKWKIFRRTHVTETIPRSLHLLEPPSHLAIIDEIQIPAPMLKAEELSVMQLVEAILRHSSVPPCAIIDAKSNIIYVHGRLGKYLEPAEGKISVNIVDMARFGFKTDLASGIRQVSQTRKKEQKKVYAIQQDGSQISVDMTISPILEFSSIPGLMMVTFEDVPMESLTETAESTPLLATSEKVAKLQQQLDFTKENLQTTIEELKTSYEELKSTNEELQSTNEELQSTNEELETSKEELQSLNEETVTVNAELQSRIEELQSANDDMKNLFDSTQIATLFLDTKFCIRRFTPKVKELINLEASDVGRPISHFSSSLQNPNLTGLASEVLRTLNKHESEICDDQGRCFYVRILPYRTTNNIIDGVVITFEDITARKEVEQALINNEERYKRMIDFCPVPMWENDFSKVEQALHVLRDQGVTDLAEYLDKHPQKPKELLKKVLVSHINNAAMELFRADDKEKLAASIQELLTRRSIQPFITQLLAIWSRRDKVSLECHCEDLQGTPLTLHLECVVPGDENQLNYDNVIVVLPRLR